MSTGEIIGVLSDLATLLGIPVALLIFVDEKRRERKEREYGTYDALDGKYQEFLVLCMENPELDLYETPLAQPPSLSPEQLVRQSALFEILVSLLERAYLMYRDQSSTVKRSQWSGWNEYMADYARHPTFRTLWEKRGVQFDRDFMAHMKAIMDDSVVL